MVRAFEELISRGEVDWWSDGRSGRQDVDYERNQRFFLDSRDILPVVLRTYDFYMMSVLNNPDVAE